MKVISIALNLPREAQGLRTFIIHESAKDELVAELIDEGQELTHTLAKYGIDCTFSIHSKDINDMALGAPAKLYPQITKMPAVQIYPVKVDTPF